MSAYSTTVVAMPCVYAPWFEARFVLDGVLTSRACGHGHKTAKAAAQCEAKLLAEHSEAFDTGTTVPAPERLDGIEQFDLKTPDGISRRFHFTNEESIQL